jgi:tetratricopeptide (TPR) repeat protein
MALATALGLILFLPWFIDHFEVVADQAQGLDEETVNASPYIWYVTWLDDILFSVGLVSFLIGSLISISQRSRRAVFLLIWFGVAFVLHSLLHRGHVRYLIPLLPSIAILSAGWLISIRSLQLRQVILWVMIIVTFMNYTLYSWHSASLPIAQAGFKPQCAGLTAKEREEYVLSCWFLYRPFELDRNANLLTIPKAIYHSYPPMKLTWPINDILDTVSKDITTSPISSTGPFYILLGAEVSGFNRVTLKYFARLRQINNQETEPLSHYGKRWESKSEHLRYLLNSNYVVIKSGYLGEAFNNIETEFNLIQEAVPSRFVFIKSFALPDGTEAKLYRQNGPLLRGFTNLKHLNSLPSSSILEDMLKLYALIDRLDPTNPYLDAAYYAGGKFYLSHQDVETAIKIYQQGTQAASSRGLSQLGLAELYLQTKKQDEALVEHQKAIQRFQDVVEKEPDNAAVWLNLAKALSHPQLAQREQQDQAITAYQQFIRLKPDNANAYIQLGNIYKEQKNQPEQAVSYYRQAVKLAPEAAWYRIFLGRTLLAVGSNEEGKRELETALLLAKDDRRIYLTLASIARKDKDWPQVIQIHEQALAQGVADVEIYLQLGDAYRVTKAQVQARNNYQKAALLAPDDPRVQKRLQIINQDK